MVSMAILGPCNPKQYETRFAIALREASEPYCWYMEPT